MKYIKLFENFFIGAAWVSGNRGTDELNNTITVPFRKQEYKDEEIAFKKGEEAFLNGDNKNPYLEEQFTDSNLIKTWQQGYDTAKANHELNEMATINKAGKKLTIDGKPLKDFTVEQLNDNILIWRADADTFLYRKGFTMVWFVKNDEAAKNLVANPDMLLFFPHRVSFTASPITDIWLKNKPLQKEIIGVIEASTFNDSIYIDMMSVRNGYMHNGINKLMIQYLIKEYPNAILKFSEPTAQGLEFIKKYYPNAKIEGKIDDSDIEYILKQLKNGDENHYITDKDIAKIADKILAVPPKYGDYSKPSHYYRDVWDMVTKYAKEN